MFKTGTRSWRLTILMAILLTLGLNGIVAGPVAAADNGVVVSNGVGPNTRPSVGVSPDSSKVCVVWSTFDLSPDRTWFRLFDVASGAWTPALGNAPYDVTKGSGNKTQGGSPRCVIDASGRTHVVWAEGNTKFIRYSSLGAGADATNAGNWTTPVTISTNTDSQTPDIAALYADSAGKVWLAYVAQNGGYDIFVRSWAPGTGWTATQQASNAGGKTAHFPRIAVDNAGNVHVTYWQSSGGGINYTRRDVGTGQFSPSVQLPDSGNAIQQSGLAVNRDTGEVHAIYIAFFSETFRVVKYVKKGGAPGDTFGAPKDLTGGGNFNTTRLGFSATGRLIMVADKRDVSPSQIVYAVSNDNGANWGPSVGLTDGGAIGFDPGLAVSDTGSGYVAYWNKNGNKINFVTLFPAPPTPRCAGFNDVAASDVACAAIEALTREGTIRGYNTTPPTFGPNNSVLRAEMATFIVRNLDWETRPKGPRTFSDLGPVGADLANNSLILANACDSAGNCVAKGYTPEACRAMRVAAPCFGPQNTVTYAQVIAFIARSYVQNNQWQQQGGGSYGNVPPEHVGDVQRYHANAGQIVDAPTTFNGWNAPAPRGWVARVLHQANEATP